MLDAECQSICFHNKIFFKGFGRKECWVSNNSLTFVAGMNSQCNISRTDKLIHFELKSEAAEALQTSKEMQQTEIKFRRTV